MSLGSSDNNKKQCNAFKMFSCRRTDLERKKVVCQMAFGLEQGLGAQASLIISLCLGPDLSMLNKLQGPSKPSINAAFLWR